MSYMDIVRHYEKCFEKYGDTNKGVDWPNERDAEIRYRVMTEIIKYAEMRGDIGNCNNSLLDFGCGLGHLYEYIIRNNIDVIYTGLDLSPIFVDKCNEKFPNVNFIKLNLLEDSTISDNSFDWVILNGVFTEKRELTYEEMLDYFCKLTEKVYSVCSRGFAFNVMSKDVDWERDDLFHLPMSTLSDFLTKKLTRDFVIRNDYGLYEYTVYVFKR